MTDFLERIQKLSQKQLAVLALRLSKELEQTKTAQTAPIAIVGIGCRFPGGIDSPDTYWKFLLEGREAIRDIPADRWNADEWFDPDPETSGRMSAKRGGFLDNITDFDPASFGITPREAATMDPQQRLLLEVAWETLEHAGIAPNSLAGSQTGVFVGICNSDHFHRVLARGAEKIDAYIASGNASSVAAGRISYTLGFSGPAISVDTACSSSLVAVHQAIVSLRTRECSLALAGGVNVICEPETMVSLSKAGMLAPDGRCKAFDASADGFSRGEGCGLVALKRLEDAERDNDQVYAVIRGSALNQDGRSAGLTVPSRSAQEALIRAALTNAGVTPQEISYVEAHGTGTRLGDPIEIRAISAALTSGRTQDQPLIVGSAKTNFGHLESAAGIAGVIKTALALHHGIIPPHLHFNEGNPEIDWDSSGVEIPTKARGWPTMDGRRLAGVSSFGFSGTNAHIVLESARQPTGTPTRAGLSSYCLPVSARSKVALLAQARRLSSAISESDSDLGSIAYTLATGRAHLPERLAISASTKQGAVEALNDYINGRESPRLNCGHVAPGQSSDVVFLCTGQGAQYPGMARGLFEHSSVFRDVIERCDAALGPQPDGRTLIDVMNSGQGPEAPIHQTEWTQPALYAVECGLAAVWRSWGVEPSAVIGHSAGEFAAAEIAGVFTLEDGLKLVAERGKLLSGLPAGGAMAALFLSEAEVAELILPFKGEVSIAAVNARDSVVISGSLTGIDAVLSQLAQQGMHGHRLHISFAAHSPLVDSALDAMEAVATGITSRPPSIPVAWNLTGGAQLPGGAPDAAYWRRHLREPVQFSAGMSSLRNAGHRVFLELGPHPVLAALAARDLDDTSSDRMPAFIGSLRRDHDDWAEMADALGKLFVEGVSVNWNRTFPKPRPRPVSLPTYPFQRSRFWIESSHRPKCPDQARSSAALLAGTQRDANGLVFETLLSSDSHDWLSDHIVHGSTLVAGPVYLSMAVGAATKALGAADWSIENFTIEHAMRLESAPLIVETRLGTESGGRVDFSIHSRPQFGSDTSWTRHAEGTLTFPAVHFATEAEDIEAAATELHPDNLAATHLAMLEGLGIKLSGRFRALDRLHTKNGVAIARLALPEGLSPLAVSFADPGLLDGILQTAGASLPRKENEESPLFFLTGIEHISLSGPLPSSIWCRATLKSPQGERRQRVDSTIFDGEGNCIGVVTGIQLTRADGYRTNAPSQYEIQWEPAPAKLSAAEFLRSPESVHSALDSAFTDLATAHGLGSYDDLLPALDHISFAYVSKAFRDLGFDESVGRRFIATEEAKRLSVAPDQTQLFSRLLQILAEENILSTDGTEFWPTYPLPRHDAADLYERAVEQFGSKCAELSILRRCGVALADVLKGEKNALGLLFPDGSLEEARQLYIEAPFARTFNGAIAELLRQVIQTVPDDHRVRILEIGGGTGGSTGSILAAFEGRQIEYVFTDVSPHFLDDASRTYGHVAGFSTDILNIESDPASQGQDLESFDIVVAANVLHATEDLCKAVLHAQSLLSPGGQLLLLEGVAPERWVDLTFGMTPGWWRFSDKSLRPDYPLISAAAWSELLHQTGLDQIARVGGEARLGRAGAQQMLIAARKPESKRHIAIVGDAGEFQEAVTHTFEARGFAVLPEAEISSDEPCDIVYLGALALANPGFAPDMSAFTEMEEAAFMAPLRHLFRLAEKHDGSRLWVATRGVHCCDGSQPAAHSRWQAPALGFGRTAALEAPSSWGGLIDLDSEDQLTAQASALVKSIVTRDDEDQCAWRNGQRFVPRLCEVPAISKDTVRFDANGTYLVTGGFGGLGTIVAKWLADHGAGRVALLGRNPEPDGPAMTAIREAGADAVAIKVDIADEASLEDALNDLLLSGPPLRGTIHAAAHLEAVAMGDLSLSQVDAMLRPKIAGTLALEATLSKRGADFLALFSSTTAVLGAPGFAHYAAANAFLDASAQNPGTGGLNVLSVGWGTWDTMRLASDDIQRTYSEQGLQPMHAEAALDALGGLINAPQSGQRLVASIDWGRLKALHETRRPRPLLSKLGHADQAARDSLKAPQANNDSSSAAKDLLDKLANAHESARRDILAQFVAAEAAIVMGEASGDAISPDRGLFEMGMDSLMSVELRRRLEVGTGLKLPTTVTFNYPNVNALAGFLDSRFGIQTSPAKMETTGKTELSQPVDDYDSISEEDLAARLRATLDSLE
ncbi:SDR family NAD(P)-dependent oxidoreductase [Hyphomonas sp.]|uniref:type I polyketide synthase n=1 Tax=Hyphomonas sp. TaxID=87 RepID=UPI0032EFB751